MDKIVPRARVCLPLGIDGGDEIVDERPLVALAVSLVVGRPTASRLLTECQRRPQGVKTVTGHAGSGAKRRRGHVHGPRRRRSQVRTRPKLEARCEDKDTKNF